MILHAFCIEPSLGPSFEVSCFGVSSDSNVILKFHNFTGPVRDLESYGN